MKSISSFEFYLYIIEIDRNCNSATYCFQASCDPMAKAKGLQ